MKRITTIALMVTLAMASAYAQQNVKMTFSGTGGASTIDLKQPNSSTGEENVAGNGPFGQFTFRNVSATTLAPQPSTTCLTGPYFVRLAGAGLFRFQDGSLLAVTLTQGGDCIDLVHFLGHCTLTFTINGGTGRFQNATGVLTYTETAMPLLGDASQNPVFFAESGEITGTISRAAIDEEPQDVRR